MCSWLPGFVGEMAPVIRFGKAKAAQARAWLLEVWREEGGCLHPFPGHHFPGVWCCFLPLHFGQPHLPQARSWGRLSSGASGCSPRSLSSAHGRPHHTPLFLPRQPTPVSLLPLRLSLLRLSGHSATSARCPSVSFPHGPVLRPLPIPHPTLKWLHPVPTLKSHCDTDDLQALPSTGPPELQTPLQLPLPGGLHSDTSQVPQLPQWQDSTGLRSSTSGLRTHWLGPPNPVSDITAPRCPSEKAWGLLIPFLSFPRLISNNPESC